jgi:hypothetical protein
VLSPIADQLMTGTQSLALTNTAWDADIPANQLTFSLGPGATAGMTINPTTGVLTWTPSTAQVPSTNTVVVRVTDDGTPPMSDQKSFQVVVRHGATWHYVTATGTASSSTIYIYLTAPGEAYVDDVRLVPGAVPGVGTNAVQDGDFESALDGLWTISDNLAGSALDPNHWHGGKSSLHVVASSSGTTRASAIYQDITPTLTSGAPYTLSFWFMPGSTNTTLIVRLSGSGISVSTNVIPYTNTAPVVAAISNQTVNAGATLMFTAWASDADQPADNLYFSLDLGAPLGTAIDPVSGVFTWTPGVNQAPSTNHITVRVTDDGVPPLSAAQSFSVTVLNPALVLGSVGLSPDDRPTFTWGSQVGSTYRVQFKNRLNDPTWQTLTDLVATGVATTFTDSATQGVTERYYRVLLVP